MQFVLLIYQGTTPVPTDEKAWATLSEDEQKQIYKDYGALNSTPGVSSGPPMGLPQDATTVTVEGRETVVSKGPYLDVEQSVGGFLVFEADDIESAVELAAKIPAARHGGAIEIRPAATYW